MSRIALVVEFHIKPNRRDDFLAIIREHAAGTKADEPGCLQFDVLVPQEGTDGVFLYEMYRDDAALAEHRQSARLAQTRSRYADLVDNRTIAMCTVG